MPSLSSPSVSLVVFVVSIVSLVVSVVFIVVSSSLAEVLSVSSTVVSVVADTRPQLLQIAAVLKSKTTIIAVIIM